MLYSAKAIIEKFPKIVNPMIEMKKYTKDFDFKKFIIEKRTNTIETIGHHPLLRPASYIIEYFS